MIKINGSKFNQKRKEGGDLSGPSPKRLQRTSKTFVEIEKVDIPKDSYSGSNIFKRSDWKSLRNNLLDRNLKAHLKEKYTISKFKTNEVEKEDHEGNVHISKVQFDNYVLLEAGIQHDCLRKLERMGLPPSKLSDPRKSINFLENRRIQQKKLDSEKLVIPDPINSRIGVSEIQKTSWDIVLESVTGRYKDISNKKKDKINSFKKIRKKIESRNTDIEYLSSRSKIRKVNKDEQRKLAKKLGKMVMKKWEYIRTILQAQEDIKKEQIKAEEGEKKLVKILEKTAQVLTRNNKNDEDSEYSSGEGSDTQESEMYAHNRFYKKGDLPEYLAQESDADESSPESTSVNEKIEQSDVSSEKGSNLDIIENDSSLLKLETENYKTNTKNESTSNVRLLRNTLRSYQQEGLEWLISQHNEGRNSILADEMGLGKTIQTIALFEHLAVNYGNWGPHLVVVPTSVLFNWEQEFKKWLPGFKVLVLYGSAKQRKQKRMGWSRKNAFHVCITSYQLVIQDNSVFRRRWWSYLVLDEAHNIKNFQSKRWQTLMQLQSEHRLLLTGTPLQNNLNELWSLVYFLLPKLDDTDEDLSAFTNLEEFQSWFAKPLNSLLDSHSNLEINASGKIILPGMRNGIEAKNSSDPASQATRAVMQLHSVLRPYILRRLKSTVEAQMPKKTEHIVYCKLSTRQRYLYDDFISRSKTRETLSSNRYLDVMSCLMQLRKVCNHPDLFEPREIVSPWAMPNVAFESEKQLGAYNAVVKLLNSTRANMNSYNSDRKSKVLILNESNASNIMGNFFPEINTSDTSFSLFAARSTSKLDSSVIMLDNILSSREYLLANNCNNSISRENAFTDTDIVQNIESQFAKDNLKNVIKHITNSEINHLRCTSFVSDLCSVELRGCVRVVPKNVYNNVNYIIEKEPRRYWDSTWNSLSKLVTNLETKVENNHNLISNFVFLVPKIITLDRDMYVQQALDFPEKKFFENSLQPIQNRLQISFPNKMLLQFDCGKLQALYELLHELIIVNGDRVLIFTQMSKMLNILEQFLALHNFRYLRLDGSTKVEHRLALTEQFNNNTKYHCFLSSTRAGGLGINLTGANCVIFYDNDWNPSMDAQCQDRCHRIGQLRNVKIYRMITLKTIEENIWQKALQKRVLDQVVIQEGKFDASGRSKSNIGFNWEEIAENILEKDVKHKDIKNLMEPEPALIKETPIASIAPTKSEKVNQIDEDELEDEKALKLALSELVNTDLLDFDEEIPTISRENSEDVQGNGDFSENKNDADKLPESASALGTNSNIHETHVDSSDVGKQVTNPDKVGKDVVSGSASDYQNEIGHIDDYIALVDYDLLKCSECGELVHYTTAGKALKPLLGDCYYIFVCNKCSGTGDYKYERMKISWIQAIYLVIYHLMVSRPEQKFFRWKEHICTMFDEYWDDLMPGKQRTATWHNTIAGSISTHSYMFKSGFNETGQPGNWTLPAPIEPSMMVINKPAHSGPKTKVSKSKKVKKPNNDRVKETPPKKSSSSGNEYDTESEASSSEEFYSQKTPNKNEGLKSGETTAEKLKVFINQKETRIGHYYPSVERIKDIFANNADISDKLDRIGDDENNGMFLDNKGNSFGNSSDEENELTDLESPNPKKVKIVRLSGLQKTFLLHELPKIESGIDYGLEIDRVKNML
ncbi:hypothetical protein BB559_004613 [Furculomyces boomerangus]|uniref:Uncharacterized protein n=1 Tax=Furculomyces boomerangus TaxID=61424 RepID=A0A2T9YDR6_9FUNG|nr:hypothetical protein BB559_004613 [Furculomyces boomerangus]